MPAYRYSKSLWGQRHLVAGEVPQRQQADVGAGHKGRDLVRAHRVQEVEPVADPERRGLGEEPSGLGDPLVGNADNGEVHSGQLRQSGHGSLHAASLGDPTAVDDQGYVVGKPDVLPQTDVDLARTGPEDRAVHHHGRARGQRIAALELLGQRLRDGQDAGGRMDVLALEGEIGGHLAPRPGPIEGQPGDELVRVVDPGGLVSSSPRPRDRTARNTDHVHVVGVQHVPLETVDGWGEGQLVVIHLGQDAAPVGSGSGLVPGPGRRRAMRASPACQDVDRIPARTRLT